MTSTRMGSESMMSHMMEELFTSTGRKNSSITKYHDKSGYYTDNGMKVEYIHELQHIMQDAGIESGGRTFIGF